MSHVSFQPRGPAYEADCDYVVVGSGAGGSTVACSLARGGAEVALVEAGAWRDPQDYPSSMYGTLRDMMDYWGATITVGRAFWPIVQGSAVGGSTVINSAIVVRTPGDIFAQWQREHGFGGDALAEAVWRHQDDLEAELEVQPASDAAMGQNSALAMHAANAIGFANHPTQRNVRDCVGAARCLQGCRQERKRSTNLNFVPEVIERRGHVLSCAPVDRVLLEGRRAIGVRGRFRHPLTRAKGAPFTIRARKGVLLAASVVHTAPLLGRSKIRHKRLGRDFRAHPGTGIFGLYDKAIHMDRGATQGWASVAFRESPGYKLESLMLPPELLAGRLKGAGTRLTARIADYGHIAMWICAVRAESAGRVTGGPWGRPMVRYSLDDADMHKLRTGCVQLARMHFAAGARAVIPGIHGLPYEIGPDQIGLLEDAPLNPRCYTGILSHLFGGTVMGTDEARSVCDPAGRVRGVDGLWVADASIIPTNLGVNPQHTIMALARVIADGILGA